jgi:hypothetical protein
LFNEIIRAVYRHRSGRCDNACILKAGNDLAQCIRLNERISIETADEFGARESDARVQRSVLAAVFLVEDAHLRVAVEPRHRARRLIGGTVVDEDDFKLLFRIVERQQRSQVAATVVASL